MAGGTSLQSVQDFMVAVMLKTLRCKPTASWMAKNLRSDGFMGEMWAKNGGERFIQ